MASTDAAADRSFWPWRFVAAMFDFTLKFEDLTLNTLPSTCWMILTPFVLYYYIQQPLYIRESPLLWLKLVSAVSIPSSLSL